MKSYPLSYATFLEYSKADNLVGLKCLDCSAYIIPPNAVCPDCGSYTLAEHSFSKKGTLRTFTIIRVGPTDFQVPYIVALVELMEGPWVMGNLVEFDPEMADIALIGKEVSIGCRLIANEDGEGPDEGVAFTFTLKTTS
jgi:uncharacterized OB-fold protein